MKEPPRNQQALAARLRNLADDLGIAEPRLRRTVAHTIVGQMLPAGVVKGGASIRFRTNEQDARLTRDLDFSPRPGTTTEDFEDQLADNLERGWHHVTGRLVTKRKAQPEGVPTEYVMQPYEIKLSFHGTAWTTVVFEVGHPEIDSTDTPEHRLAEDIGSLFADLGLPVPEPIAVMAAAHQAAQKIHACTGPTASQRAHDLVDLQILNRADPLDPIEVAEAGARLFAYRRQQPWPPTVVAHDTWPELYAAATSELATEVLPLDSAVAWLNALIRRSGRP
ncbi:MAG: nucleotidyl transferase AbiEii/AbiGii toxin family protein [Ilumatobacter sp.]|uniref:nucleotidyl transferase AbiEii/AbiGii toxin family protein n=1 Tax=Ilumatobacter sp. TaxID=1967498 RepID=UPI0026342C49|nr:nucleotidyl transferase AbiEii/AbiGii toxin family protein [Ilumatobacter sp.]MDJ0770310.1 nucleotidyl transferase AbiEii/AbiGii toxin family protein [Ilumatobacter sp.]